jgi:hypothetical protein
MTSGFTNCAINYIIEPLQQLLLPAQLPKHDSERIFTIDYKAY